MMRKTIYPLGIAFLQSFSTQAQTLETTPEQKPEKVQASTQARLAVTGDVLAIRVGQEGFCGKRHLIQRDAYTKIMVEGGKRVWIDADHSWGSMQCLGDYTFVPEAAAIYVIRNVQGYERCGIQLYRVIDSNKLRQEPIEKSTREACPLF